MHIPDDRFITKSIISRRVISDFGLSIPSRPDRNAGLLGPMVSGRSAPDRVAGRHVLFYPTAIGWHPAEKAEFGEAQHDAWRTIQRAHAIANGVYVGVVNRVGFETGNIRGNEPQGAGLEFWGGSFFADPFGRVMAQGSHDKEEILSAKSICVRWRKFAGTGLFCGIGGSMLMTGITSRLIH